MQFDIHSVDPPASGFAVALGLLVAVGTLAGLASLVLRVARRRVAPHDPLVWLSGCVLGVAWGTLTNEHVTFLILLVTGASMCAAAWLAVKHEGDLRMVGLRLLESATLLKLVALWSGGR